MNRCVLVVVIMCICLPGAQRVGAQNDEPMIERVGPEQYRIGSVLLDGNERTVRCAGYVNMDEGNPVELLACTPRGKTHESVLVLNIEPKELQIALLLLGLRQGRNPAAEWAEDSPEAARPPGDEVQIFVVWAADDGQDKARTEVTAESLLMNQVSGEPLAGCRWVFLGSRMVGHRFGADIEGSLVATYRDPLAILELVHETVNDDTFHGVNSGLCPPEDTPVELVVQVPEREDVSGEGLAREQGERTEQSKGEEP